MNVFNVVLDPENNEISKVHFPSRAEKEQLIQEYLHSNLTLTQFCKEKGLTMADPSSTLTLNKENPSLDEILEIKRRWKESGDPMPVYAERIGVSKNKMSYWIYQVAVQAERGARIRTPAAKTAEQPAAPKLQGLIVTLPNGTKLEFGLNESAEWIASVINKLK